MLFLVLLLSCSLAASRQGTECNINRFLYKKRTALCRTIRLQENDFHTGGKLRAFVFVRVDDVAEYAQNGFDFIDKVSMCIDVNRIAF